MTSSNDSTRVERIHRLAAEGDTYRLAKEIFSAAQSGETDTASRITDTLADLPEFEAAKLANDVLHLYRTTVMQQWVTRGWTEQEAQGDELSLWGPMTWLKELVVKGLASCSDLKNRFEAVDDMGRSFHLPYPHTYELFRVVEKSAELSAGQNPSVSFLAALRRSLRSDGWAAGGIESLSEDQLACPVLNPGEAWADRALADTADSGRAWPCLLRHALTARATKPSAAWTTKAKAHIKDVGPEEFRRTVVRWLPSVREPRSVPLVHNSPVAFPGMFDPYNAVALRGLVWMLGLVEEDRDAVQALGDLLEFCLREVPGMGPRHPRLANAVVHTLAGYKGAASLAELARLSHQITWKPTLKSIRAALHSCAESMGVSREDLEEITVPTHFLTRVGSGESTVGVHTAVISVRDGKGVLTWRHPTGRTTRAAPGEVRLKHAADVKELNARVKEIDKTLRAETRRLERLLASRRTWTFSSWCERYADHPLLGTLTRRLLWTVEGRTYGYADGRWRDHEGTPLEADARATVSLWHPVGQDAGCVEAWRNLLLRHDVSQPFQQADREIYRINEEERRTRTHSNRFAARTLHQHQFSKLAASRGWRYGLRMAVDDEYPPAMIDFPAWGVRAEYWVEGVEHDVGVSGSFLTVRTDQIRFYPVEAPENYAHADGRPYRMPDGHVEPQPLDTVPELVFSEVLRDVGFFVGVAGVKDDQSD
ncbi:DUF4132 domain-containing protein [Streptomyces sp. NPDC018955]|uniref:DUF4132 domain-containing protein n=1 Tax=Streptomyces sp. NPDC018955 TaxID=3365055 RepID=UPI003798F3A2